MLQIIMYQNAKSKVRINNSFSDVFKVQVGVHLKEEYEVSISFSEASFVGKICIHSKILASILVVFVVKELVATQFSVKVASFGFIRNAVALKIN